MSMGMWFDLVSWEMCDKDRQRGREDMRDASELLRVIIW